MSIADKSLTIDVWGSVTSVSLIQGESAGRKLCYTITNGSTPINLTGREVTLFIVKPDATVVYTNCDIDDAEQGKVSFVVSSQMVAVAGLGSGEFHVIDADGTMLKTPKIGIAIEPSHDVDGATESSNEFSVLVDLINSIPGGRVFSTGRPDKPETTLFSAAELAAMPVGTEFVSTDGANVGAWVWTKYGREDEPSTPATAKGWAVTSGDTGNVIVTPTNVTGGAKIVFRRVNNTIFSSLGFQGPWGTFGIDENAIALEGTKFELGVTPQGFGTKIAQTMLLSRDGKEMITDAIYNVLTRTRDGGKIQIRCKDATTANALKGQTLLRAASIRWVTNETWPDVI
jgi:archaellin